jgi:amino acid transporter
MRRVLAILWSLLAIFGALVIVVVVVGLIFPERLAQWSRSALPAAPLSNVAAFLWRDLLWLHLLLAAIAIGGLWCLLVWLYWRPQQQAASVQEMKDRLPLRMPTVKPSFNS